MTDIEQKALALVNEVRTERGWQPHRTLSQYDCSRTLTLCRAIEQHEAFRQDVSDALEKRGFYIDDRDLGRFIIAKPDPLVEALIDCGLDPSEGWPDEIRAAIEKRGGKIVWGEG